MSAHDVEGRVRPLMRLAIEFGTADALDIGYVATGRRSIIPVTGGTFDGPRLAGSVLPHGFDWALELTDGSRLCHVRALLRTVDGALVQLVCDGRLQATDAARFLIEEGRGHTIDPSEYSLAVRLRFECGDPRHDWLNRVQAIATAELDAKGAVYTVIGAG